MKRMAHPPDAFDRFDSWLNRNHIPLILAVFSVGYVLGHVVWAWLS